MVGEVFGVDPKLKVLFVEAWKLNDGGDVTGGAVVKVEFSVVELAGGSLEVFPKLKPPDIFGGSLLPNTASNIRPELAIDDNDGAAVVVGTIPVDDETMVGVLVTSAGLTGVKVISDLLGSIEVAGF